MLRTAIFNSGVRALKKILALFVALAWAHPIVAAEPLPLSPSGVKTLSPDGAIKPTGPWSLGVRAGGTVQSAALLRRPPIATLRARVSELLAASRARGWRGGR